MYHTPFVAAALAGVLMSAPVASAGIIVRGSSNTQARVQTEYGYSLTNDFFEEDGESFGDSENFTSFPFTAITGGTQAAEVDTPALQSSISAVRNAGVDSWGNFGRAGVTVGAAPDSADPNGALSISASTEARSWVEGDVSLNTPGVGSVDASTFATASYTIRFELDQSSAVETNVVRSGDQGAAFLYRIGFDGTRIETIDLIGLERRSLDAGLYELAVGISSNASAIRSLTFDDRISQEAFGSISATLQVPAPATGLALLAAAPLLTRRR